MIVITEFDEKTEMVDFYDCKYFHMNVLEKYMTNKWVGGGLLESEIQSDRESYVRKRLMTEVNKL